MSDLAKAGDSGGMSGTVGNFGQKADGVMGGSAGKEMNIFY